MLSIKTLGSFQLRKEAISLTEHNKRSAKLWDLFKYFITNRDISIPTDKIVESLWPDHYYENQEAALHALVHRLRKLINKYYPKGQEPFEISASKGSYHFTTNYNCLVDTDKMTEATMKGLSLAGTDPQAALANYKKAVLLYKGDYLPEYPDASWILPSRRYYRNLYLQSLIGKIKILMAEGSYEEACQACERAFKIDLFSEVDSLQILFMESLLKLSKHQEALCHYELLTSYLYQQFNVKPSPEIRDLYRKIKSNSRHSDLISLTSINETLKERDLQNGPFVCDEDFFRYLYRLEQRRSERTGRQITLVMLTLEWNSHATFSNASQKEKMNIIENILVESLRRGDVITKVADSQYIVLLIELDRNQVDQISNRIRRQFNQITDDNNIKLKLEIKAS